MHPAFVVSVALSVAFVSVLVFWSRVRSARAQAIPANGVVRMATLDAASRRTDATWWLSTAFALLPLLLTSALLAARWNDLPVRLPIHWGMDGQANGWTLRSPLTVFGPLAGGAAGVLLLTLGGITAALSSPGFAGRQTVLGTTRGALRGAAWIVSLLCCAAAALPLAHNSKGWVVAVIGISGVASLSLLAFVVYRSLSLPDAVLTAARRTTEDRFWTASIFYRNSEDPALWVPKRSGLGYTLNFGRPVAWVLTGGLLVFILLYPVALHTILRR